MDNPQHISVLLSEVLGFVPEGAKVCIDGTLGLGGHAKAILEQFALDKYWGFDKDMENAEVACERLKSFKNFELINAGFEEMGERIEEESADFVLLDLGLCSTQVDDGERGFSFNKEAELDMRFDRTKGKSAKLIINTYREEDLARIFWEYGEERLSRKLARVICQHRPFETTTELADFISKVVKGHTKVHPATKVFQALRIEANDELEVLRSGLEGAKKVLKSGGRLCVISYHSLEDRIVKNTMRDWSKDCLCPPEIMVCQCGHTSEVKVLTKKSVVPREEEIETNPRSRSARMRVCEKK